MVKKNSKGSGWHGEPRRHAEAVKKGMKTKRLGKAIKRNIASIKKMKSYNKNDYGRVNFKRLPLKIRSYLKKHDFGVDSEGNVFALYGDGYLTKTDIEDIKKHLN